MLCNITCWCGSKDIEEMNSMIWINALSFQVTIPSVISIIRVIFPIEDRSNLRTQWKNQIRIPALFLTLKRSIFELFVNLVDFNFTRISRMKQNQFN